MLTGMQLKPKGYALSHPDTLKKRSKHNIRPLHSPTTEMAAPPVAPQAQSGIDNSLCESGSPRQFQFTITMSLLGDKTQSWILYRFYTDVPQTIWSEPEHRGAQAVWTLEMHGGPCVPPGLPLQYKYAMLPRRPSAEFTSTRSATCCENGMSFLLHELVGATPPMLRRRQ